MLTQVLSQANIAIAKMKNSRKIKFKKLTALTRFTWYLPPGEFAMKSKKQRNQPPKGCQLTALVWLS